MDTSEEPVRLPVARLARPNECSDDRLIRNLRTIDHKYCTEISPMISDHPKYPLVCSPLS